MLIGLAGKSCSGKNHIGALLEKRGLVVLDCDRISHTLLDESAAEVALEFGPQVLLPDGRVDRKALGEIVFRDADKRTRLEAMLYGRLGEEIRRAQASTDRDVVVNGALIHRSGFDAWCACLVYVDAPYDVRVARAALRDGIDARTFSRREASQSDVDFRDVEYACPVIVFDNSGKPVSDVDIDGLLAKIDEHRRAL